MTKIEQEAYEKAFNKYVLEVHSIDENVLMCEVDFQSGGVPYGLGGWVGVRSLVVVPSAWFPIRFIDKYRNGLMKMPVSRR